MTNFLFKFLLIFTIIYLTGNFDLFYAFCDDSNISHTETQINQNPQETTTQETTNPYYFYFGLLLFFGVFILTLKYQAGPDNLTEALERAAVTVLTDFKNGVDNTAIYEITGYPEEKGNQP